MQIRMYRIGGMVNGFVLFTESNKNNNDNDVLCNAFEWLRRRRASRMDDGLFINYKLNWAHVFQYLSMSLFGEWWGWCSVDEYRSILDDSSA